MTKKIRMAIAYDFDGTLSPDYMQHASFLPKLGIIKPKEEFWDHVKKHTQEQNMDEILAYMFFMLHEASYRGISIKKESFIEHGRRIKFFPGVEYWFDRINDYAKERNVAIKHYIISSGLREMIEGTSIYNKFAHVYASGYAYNQDNIAVWPATAVNYTNKTQHIFRINKGIENSWDNESVNKFILPHERPIPAENIVYVGDGDTDIPAMKMTKYLGGKAIAVYNPKKHGMKEAADRLILQDRADYSLRADYREGKELDLTVKSIIDSIKTKKNA